VASRETVCLQLTSCRLVCSPKLQGNVPSSS